MTYLAIIEQSGGCTHTTECHTAVEYQKSDESKKEFATRVMSKYIGIEGLISIRFSRATECDVVTEYDLG